MRRSNFRRIRRGEAGSLHELNITPLLDLVFVLLVIFIITTPQMTNSVEINLPSGKTPPPDPKAPKPKIHRVTVDESGRALLDGNVVTIVELKKKLGQLHTANPDAAIVVEGAADVPYQSMIDVLDVLQQLDITKVGLATQSRDATTANVSKAVE